MTIGKQDSAKPHQANMLREYLDSIFEERMLAIRAVRGDSFGYVFPRHETM